MPSFRNLKYRFIKKAYPTIAIYLALISGFQEFEIKTKTLILIKCTINITFYFNSLTCLYLIIFCVSVICFRESEMF